VQEGAFNKNLMSKIFSQKNKEFFIDMSVLPFFFGGKVPN
jgi:hypothetical protein